VGRTLHTGFRETCLAGGYRDTSHESCARVEPRRAATAAEDQAQPLPVPHESEGAGPLAKTVSVSEPTV
jgi:hypothetical protein